MNFMDLIKKAFSNSWTGGASIDPRTGELGAPNRFHGKGTFDDFKMADLFNNDRWVGEKIGDPNPKSDRQMYTSYYIPKTERREEDVTDTTKIVDGVATRTFTKKYKTGGRSGEGSSSYDPIAREPALGQQNQTSGISDDAWFWAGANPSMNANYRRNPGYPGQQGLPSISRAQQYMPPQSDINNQRLGMNPGGVRVQRPIPEGVNEMTNSYRPLPRSGIGTRYGTGQLPSALGEAGSMLSKSLPSGLHPGYESGYGANSKYGTVDSGIRSRKKQEIAKILEFLGYLYPGRQSSPVQGRKLKGPY